MELENLGDRIIHARKRLGWSQAALIRRSGVPQGSVSKMERGDQLEAGKYLLPLSRALNVRPLWLSNGEGGMDEQVRNTAASHIAEPTVLTSQTQPEKMPTNAHRVRYADLSDILVLQYRDTRFSAGPGYQNNDYKELEEVAFKQSYMEKNGLVAERCFVVYARGDSMWPCINDGDVILVNTDVTDPRKVDRGIFAFVDGDDCRVKRVYFTSTGSMRLVSDNPDKSSYPDETISGNDLNQLEILGHVHWSGGNK